MESKSYEAESRKHWDQLHEQSRFRPRFPNDHVVRFLLGNYSQAATQQMSALDIGVGGGRHTKLLCELGFQTFGIDISEEGLRHTQEWLASEGRSAVLKPASMSDLPFPDAQFEVVLAFGVYNYSIKKDMERAVAELHRVLRPGGRALIVTRSDKDYRFGKGTELEPGTWRIEIADTNEQGTVQRFLREDQVSELVGRFSEVSFERSETTFGNRRGVNSDWLIFVRK
jgi:SAM-dependent methyltransferase